MTSGPTPTTTTSATGTPTTGIPTTGTSTAETAAPGDKLDEQAPTWHEIRCVQPGESGVFILERLWGRWRRAWLRLFRPSHVARMRSLRQGDCPDCPHDILDPRDLKLYRNVCGYWFAQQDDPFRWRDRLPFARMGLAEVVILGGGGLTAGTLLLFTAPLLAVLPFAFALFIFWFFRDPSRQIPDDPTAILSPCDGVVDDIVELPGCRVLEGPVLRIGISLSLFNVHINRTPIRSRVAAVHYFRGVYKNAMRKGDHSNNEQLWTVYAPDTAPNRPIAVRQIAGPVARRIVCEVRTGQELAAGAPFGMIKFGSRTELYLPSAAGYEPKVHLGMRVRGGQTVLGRFS